MRYDRMNRAQLEQQLALMRAEYEKIKSQQLNIDMTRGKPCTEQLELARGLFDDAADADFSENGSDVRNYGMLTGLPSLRRLFAQLGGFSAENTVIGGSSSINLIFDCLSRAYTVGMPDSPRPWGKEENVKIICPVPGYDRHFTICEHFGAQMLPVKMLPDGPDMDEVERLALDSTVKGLICVPVYSNPTGVTFSAETVERLAKMTAAAPDFTIFWDNAYALHHLTERCESVPDIISLCERYGHDTRALVFMSTSKVTLPGAGVTCVAGSKRSFDALVDTLKTQTISYNKVNQYFHVRYLKNPENIRIVMRRHAAIIAPKFNAVLEILDRELTDSGAAQWSRPSGGYFISFYAHKGTAAEIVRLCNEAGVRFTPAGSAYPYGLDPDDTHIRIAPTMPQPAQLKQAAQLLCVASRLTLAEKLLGEN